MIRRKIGKAFGLAFYPGIAAGILTENHKEDDYTAIAKPEDWGEDEIHLYEVRHVFMLPFIKFCYETRYVRYDNEEMFLSWVDDVNEYYDE